LTTIEKHIKDSSLELSGLMSKLDLNSGMIEELADDSLVFYTEAKGWHVRESQQLAKINEGIKVLTTEEQIKIESKLCHGLVSPLFASSNDFIDGIRKDIIDWLRNTDPSTNQENAIIKHEPHTGTWFTHGHQYREWLHTSGFIWLQGSAGCGKTILW